MRGVTTENLVFIIRDAHNLVSSSEQYAMRFDEVERPDAIGESEPTEQLTSSMSPVPSPAATGGAGTFFEQHVDAYWLGLLLVRAIPPILIDCTLEHVHLQTRHLGWQTDDFLVMGKNESGQQQKLAGQVKRTFTVSARDAECKKTIKAFWKDFKNTQQFSSDSDRFVLVTLRGTNNLLVHFSGLLDCARASQDGTDFEYRMALPNFINRKSVQYCNDIRKIVSEIEDRNVSITDIWSFLRVMHVLSLDLNSATGQAEATIKSLLAHATSEPDAVGVADATWNALLRVVSEGMPGGRSYRREDLPEELINRHRPIADTEHSVLQSLSNHSALILDGIRSTIGSFHLERHHLVQQVIEHLESAQVILISGPAGSGKSVVAKDVLRTVRDDYFTFSFRAEEFARAHLDETLQAVQISANAATIGAILAGQDRKVLLVESVERLLEKPTRNAFVDLLSLVKKDRSWCLVLTCRDYSTNLVQSAFLGHESVAHPVVAVPPLDDEELEEIKEAYPSLAYPLTNTPLRRVLNNPYLLDKALQIEWSVERPLPHSEQEFRKLFWREIVRADHRRTGGMPSLRENAFVEVALRRARALTMYVACEGLDSEIVEALRHDSLIVYSQESNSLLAPAHDVMEDWAILHWIQKLYLKHEGSLWELSAAIGTFPAVRRTYRKWATELVESSPDASDRMFQDIVTESGIPSHFRDDTLVSLLDSSSSATFFERHAAELLANDNQFLRQVIRILRVACLTAPAWLGSLASPASVMNVPEGPAWASVLHLIQTHLSSFTQKDNYLLLGLIQDWARSVNWQNPYPEGAEAAATIAHWLLPFFPSYSSREEHKIILQIIARIPKANAHCFDGLLQECREREIQGIGPDHLLQIIFADVHGMPLVRDMPDLAISAAKDYLLCSEPSLQSQWVYERHLELEPLFGIKKNRHFGFFPASALHGPFLPLLQHHPYQGVDFIVEVFNHSADWYAHPRLEYGNVERPFEITLTFADRTSRSQWCNPRLWNLYRGTSVGPYVLQSMLMALEHWLLEFAENCQHQLDEFLLSILQRSDSAAITAVVASVATAFPQEACETLLVLLRCCECILLDRERFAMEVHAPSTDALPQINDKDRVYEEERKQSDARPNRKYDLEAAIFHLQLGPLAVRVHQILDQHRAELPPPENQNREHRVWRMALNRMDSRCHTVSEHVEENSTNSDDHTSPEDDRRYIRLDPNEPEPDLREMMDQSNVQMQIMNARAGLLMWGINAFDSGEENAQDTSQWRQRLREARSTAVEDNDAEEDRLFREAPGFVASVCVRDYWEEMSVEEQAWCFNTICSVLERDDNQHTDMAYSQLSSMSAGRPCAWVLPLLFGVLLSGPQQIRAKQTLAIALTHPVRELRRYVASSIGTNLWKINRDLAFRCVNALAIEAMLMQHEVDANSTLPYTERCQIDDIAMRVFSIVRERFDEAIGIPNDAFRQFDPTRGFGAGANNQILTILGQVPSEPLAIMAFEQLAHTLVGWWNDAEQQSGREGPRHERNYDLESVLERHLGSFLLRTSLSNVENILQPILQAIDRNPKEVHRLVRDLVSVEDRQPNTPQFWSIWNLFADSIRRAQWISRIDDEHASGTEMISVIFLGPWWKEEVRHWRSLEGYVGSIHSLFEDLPFSATVLDEYVRFLFQIGEQSLPDAFIRIANKLNQESSSSIAKRENLIFHLEVLLQSYVYWRPLELKHRHNLREAVLFLLDLLVENGSSAAYRMRDDFVTPVPPN